MTTYFTIQQIKDANKAAGKHFFDASAMRFFDSKIASQHIYAGHFFITSEQFHGSQWSEPRKYTIRVCDNGGNVGTVGELQAYATVEQAHKAAARLVYPESVCANCRANITYNPNFTCDACQAALR